MEFVRDKGGLFWYIFFPFFMIFGFAFAFSGGEDAALTVGVWPQNAENAILSDIDMPSISTIEFSDRNRAVEQVRTHQVDLLIDTVNKVYIKNALSEKSALAEQIVLSKTSIPLQAENISGQSLRYIDWLLPGVIGMNMMFSCLFGVGWVVVRYRKNGFLETLKSYAYQCTGVCDSANAVPSYYCHVYVCAGICGQQYSFSFYYEWKLYRFYLLPRY